MSKNSETVKVEGVGQRATQLWTVQQSCACSGPSAVIDSKPSAAGSGEVQTPK